MRLLKNRLRSSLPNKSEGTAMQTPRTFKEVIKAILATVFFVAFVCGAWFWLRHSYADAELNALVYTGYDEPEIAAAFEKDSGIKLRPTPFFGGDEMHSILRDAKGDYDMVVVDPEYLKKLVASHLIQPLVATDYNSDDYYPRFKRFADFYIDDKLYAIPVRFGVNGLVFNTEKVSRENVRSYKSIWSESLKGHVGLVDSYLISMGAVSKALGNEDAYDLGPEAFDFLRRRMLALKPRLSGIYSIPEMFKALAGGELWVLPCGGESVVYNLRDRKQFDWLIPDEGGIMWVEGLAIVKNARHVASARRFIQWAQRPAAQALLATRRAYASNVPNRKAYDLLSAEDRAILRSASETELESLLSRLTVRSLPRKQSEAEWTAVWQDFKGH
jgi:spermidine/putrescine transport system substrate-binding protein